MPSSNSTRRSRRSNKGAGNEKLTETRYGKSAAIKTKGPDTVPVSKIGQVIASLETTEGLTLAQLTDLTGWLPHTARAALTGLRKRGYKIERSTADGISIYRIAGGQA